MQEPQEADAFVWCANFVDGFEPEAGNGAGDLAFAYAIAAANLRVVRQGGNRRRGVQRDAPGVALPKDQGFAHLANVDAALQKIEEPRAIGGVAIHHGADDLVVLQHEAAVIAARGVAQHDFLAILAIGEIAGGVEIDAGNFEFGRGRGRNEFRRVVSAKLRRHNIRHLVKRGDKAIGDAMRLCAFAKRENDSGSLVRIVSSTTMPRLTASPASAARADSGGCPRP